MLIILVILEQKSCTKFLGVVINEYLNWSDHIKYISTPIARNIGILCKLRHYLPVKTLFMLYNTLILPYFSYCSIIWANSYSSTNSIFILQKKAIRICAGDNYRDHTDPIFSRHEILRINDIHFMQTAIFMFHYNAKLLPLYFEKMFQANREVHSYPTRHGCNIHLTNPKTALAHKSIRHTGPDVWNSLPPKIRNLNSTGLFKKSLKHMLLERYQ